ncbi:MAG: hypothetical protein HYV63_12195 [Candidatus Schekmanbacteria bacterium]|nr:hypothetical protein [Candidatus Schekmanbacteria bacterium]
MNDRDFALPWLAETADALACDIGTRCDEQARVRLARGLHQIAAAWRPEDGDRAIFEAFVHDHFAADQRALDCLFARYDELLEQISGHMTELHLSLARHATIDTGLELPVDTLFAALDPSAHFLDDCFATKLAHVVLLNFPVTTLEERAAHGDGWTRRQWAEARLGLAFAYRVPAEIRQRVQAVYARVGRYVDTYNIWMHHVLDPSGNRLFPPRLRLISHWTLRDEIRGAYGDGAAAIGRQRLVQRVLERIIEQSIPAAVVDNPGVDWNVLDNTVRAATVEDGPESLPRARGVDLGSGAAPREPDTRYALLLEQFHARRQLDAYGTAGATAIDRSFDEGREMSEERVRALLAEVVSSPLVGRVAKLVARRLGRPLEPFDIWYYGFRANRAFSEDALDSIVKARFPDGAAFHRQIPAMLQSLGFAPDRARELAANILVEPARGSGHACGCAMRGAKARLRTRIDATGMTYKSFNIAVHEMGHNVERTISVNDMDHHLLQGVPNTAFTEAVAMVFQARDLELLGVTSAARSPEAAALDVLDDFWQTVEIAGTALVELDIWHWLYAHPDATPESLREATLDAARARWNEYFASAYGIADVTLLAVYSHMLVVPLYLPNYPLGHLIARQIEEHMRGAASVGEEIDRICRCGLVSPDLWMKLATGSPVGAGAMLLAAEKAARQVERGGG